MSDAPNNAREEQLKRLLAAMLKVRTATNSAVCTALHEIRRRLSDLANDDRVRVAFVRTLVDVQLVEEPEPANSEDSIAAFLRTWEEFRAELVVSICAIEAVANTLGHATALDDTVRDKVH